MPNRKSKSNPYFVFDYDDTLVRSRDTNMIKVVNKTDGSLIKELFLDQYPSYSLKANESIDYSDFENGYDDLEGVAVIQDIWDRFVARIEAFGAPRTVILTARINPRPVESFLDFKGVTGVIVNAVGSTLTDTNTTKINALNKKNFIKTKLLDELGADYVEFYDDNRLNIQRAKELRADYPEATIKTFLIKDNRRTRN